MRYLETADVEEEQDRVQSFPVQAADKARVLEAWIRPTRLDAFGVGPGVALGGLDDGQC